MKKKMAEGLLAVGMAVLLLAGCSGTGNEEGTQAAGDGADAGRQEENNIAPGQEEGDDGSETGNTAKGASDVDETTLTMATTFSETEFAGQVISYFKDYLSEHSDGKINLEIYWGGTFANSSEELSFVSSGAADMSVLNQNNYTDVLPLLNFPSQIYGEDGFQGSIDIFTYMMEENAETAALIQAENEAQNLHMLGGMPAGTNCFVTKSECATLADLTKLKLGAGINLSAFESLGFHVVSIMPQEYYDSLSRGIVDTGYMPVSVFVSMSMQEVTPYFICDSSYTAGNFFTMNLDKWNSLSDGTKAVFQEAMEATQKYSVDLANTQTQEASATIEAAGGKVVYLPEEDQKAIQDALFATGLTDSRSYAETAGCVEEMETILTAVGEYLGLSVE